MLQGKTVDYNRVAGDFRRYAMADKVYAEPHNKLMALIEACLKPNAKIAFPKKNTGSDSEDAENAMVDRRVSRAEREALNKVTSAISREEASLAKALKSDGSTVRIQQALNSLYSKQTEILTDLTGIVVAFCRQTVELIKATLLLFEKACRQEAQRRSLANKTPSVNSVSPQNTPTKDIFHADTGSLSGTSQETAADSANVGNSGHREQSPCEASMVARDRGLSPPLDSKKYPSLPDMNSACLTMARSQHSPLTAIETPPGQPATPVMRRTTLPGIAVIHVSGSKPAECGAKPA